LIGGIVFAAGFALAIWAIVTFRTAGTRVETIKPTLAIVMHGLYRFTRNPIYLGMSLGLVRQSFLAAAMRLAALGTEAQHRPVKARANAVTRSCGAHAPRGVRAIRSSSAYHALG
jgi:protein-S-isoprenylcysteine O-methyltransferase Ste14